MGWRRPKPPHSDAFQAAVITELQRLTLPHHPATDRRELKVKR